MDHGWIALLRLVHIVCGVLWIGGVVMVSVFLIPAARDLGPSGGALMEYLTRVRRLPIYLMAVAILTVLVGITLFMIDSSSYGSAWAGSPAGIAYSIGGVLALATVAVGMAVNSPAGRRLGNLAAEVRASGNPPTPEQSAAMGQLRRRLAGGAYASAILGLLAAAAMAVARYI